MKSGNVNFLEPSGPLQACNGTALPYMSIQLLSGTHRNGEYVKGLEGGSRDVFQSIALFAWTH